MTLAAAGRPNAGFEVDNPALIVGLDQPVARAVGDVGRKAANLAVARCLGLPVLPGFVILPGAVVEADVRPAWAELSAEGTLPLVVRSSSAAEDGEQSSMAGRFTSVVDVLGWPAFVAAVEEVRASAVSAGVAEAPMAVLVQPQLDCAWGGVMFGVDPVTGRQDRLVVAAVPGAPHQLVSGAVSGSRHVLTRRCRMVAHDGDPAGRFPTMRQRRALLALSRQAGRAFGGPQDIEWAFGPGPGARGSKLHLWLLQSRPITAVAAVAAGGPCLGPGPLAETFPDALSPLEQAMWVEPLRKAVAVAVQMTGSAGARRLEASPLVVVVGGRVAIDLDLVDGGAKPTGWRRIDPRPSLRRLGAAWRVGRLRGALPTLASDLVGRVDADLAHVPALGTLGDEALLRLLRQCREGLTAVHGLEMLAGLLKSGEGETTAAALALRKLVASRVEGLSDAEIVGAHPEVLALTVPSIGLGRPLPPLAPGTLPGGVSGALPARESLRLRARWLHELTALAAWELGGRLARLGVLTSQAEVSLLTWDELERAVADHRPPGPLAGRAEAGTPLPAAFRLGPDGQVVPVRAPGGRAKGVTGDGQGAGGGRGVGPVTTPEAGISDGDILVVRTLDPDLAVHLPRLAGLVAETGSVLSHLAILAREFGVPTVVGVDGALERFAVGTTLLVDGGTGELSPQDPGAREISLQENSRQEVSRTEATP